MIAATKAISVRSARSGIAADYAGARGSERSEKGGLWSDRSLAKNVGKRTVEIAIGMENSQKRLFRRGLLRGCVIGAALATGAYLLGGILKPPATSDQVIEITRSQMPIDPVGFPAHSLYEKMAKNDAILTNTFGPRPLASAAYRCKFNKYKLQYFYDNHFDDPVERLIVSLDDINESNSNCISKVIIAPNVVATLVPERKIPFSMRRLIRREPSDWLN